MALRVSQIQCAASEQGLLRNYLCRRWQFSPEQNTKWNSISTSPRQKKERKLQSNSVYMYSEMESSLLISSPPPPLLIRFREPPPHAILSIPSTSSLIFGSNGKTEVKVAPLPVTLKSLKFRGFDVYLFFSTLRIQCATLEEWLLWNYLGRRWPFSRQRNITWNSVCTSPKQKKDWKLQSNNIQVYSEIENSPLISSNSPPPNSIFKTPPRAILSIPNTSSLIRSKWENGSEDGCTSGHSVELKVSGFRCLFIYLFSALMVLE
ncbi:hypothetical protein CDAR_281541 [Caerostris darwini]|uniref:Uncharacterized protein n=1 Tax=Caerostris darwini TaxID=1538125 RepID=A0AAV4QVB8_9ARAC|nr:hypothetical protein CDAR_281541 [Caerostris darwini]